jgi:choline dehydrogenase
LLKLSGIGQPEVLQAAGIEGRHELCGIGENLRDHYSPRMKWAVPHALGMTYNARARGLGMAWQALRCDYPQGAAGPSGGAGPPMSVPAPGATGGTPRSRGSRFWSATISNWRRIPA